MYKIYIPIIGAFYTLYYTIEGKYDYKESYFYHLFTATILHCITMIIIACIQENT